MTKKQKNASELIPKNDIAVQVLQGRAELLAKEELGSFETNEIAYICFALGNNEQYGIAYQHVRELLHHANMARPPCVPSFIAGVINWRGTLITVVDLNHFFHPQHAVEAGEFIIVLNVNEITLGIMIPQIKGSNSYQLAQLSEPLLAAKSVNSEYILGLDKSIIAIINVEALVLGLIKETKKGVHRIGDVYGNHL